MWKLIYLSFVIFIIVAYLIPKRLSKIEIYATTLFALIFGLTVDIVLDLHYNLYGYLEKGFQWLGLLAIYLYFPSISVLFLNLYPSKSNIMKKIMYILGWTIFSIIFEWFSVHTKFFYYNGWKLWYSAVCYPIIYSTLLINLKVIRSIQPHSTISN